jgi:hypothetical protein
MTADMIRAEKQITDSPMIGGARFTEIMDGYIYIGDGITDYECAVNAAKGSESTARFYLSVDAWDINALKYKDNHAAMLTGTFSAGALSSDPFMVLRGEFQLFSDDPNTPDTHNLVYDFDMISVYPLMQLTSDLWRNHSLSWVQGRRSIHYVQRYADLESYHDVICHSLTSRWIDCRPRDSQHQLEEFCG